MSAKIVKNAIQESLSTFQSPWAPTPENLNITSAKRLIPHQLLNWIAWTTGLSDTPHAETYVNVSGAEEKKSCRLPKILYTFMQKAKLLLRNIMH